MGSISPEPWYNINILFYFTLFLISHVTLLICMQTSTKHSVLTSTTTTTMNTAMRDALFGPQVSVILFYFLCLLVFNDVSRYCIWDPGHSKTTGPKRLLHHCLGPSIITLHYHTHYHTTTPPHLDGSAREDDKTRDEQREGLQMRLEPQVCIFFLLLNCTNN